MPLYTNKSSTQGNGAPLSDSSAAPIGTPAAGTSTNASRADHVHGLPTGFTGVVFNTAGAISQATAGTHYLAPDWDVISRQTLGGDAQEITLALAGNTDERYVIQGYGPTDGAGNAFTLRVNDNATPVTYSYYYSTVGVAVAAAADGAGFTYDQGTGFTITFDASLISGSQRGGICDGWTRNTSGAIRARWSAAFNWSNTTDNVTQLILRGFDANTWKSGFKVIVLKRKFSA
jgi:hypothetical protein